MDNTFLTSANIDQLSSLKKTLFTECELSKEDKKLLFELLLSFELNDQHSLFEIPTVESISLKVLNNHQVMDLLEKWKQLFSNIPGFDGAGVCYTFEKLDEKTIEKNIVMTAMFCPSVCYNSIILNEPYEVHLKDNGTANFWFPTLKDAEQYPELYNFKGSWKDAYLLLIETLKKGWPMEEFPEELLPLLKK